MTPETLKKATKISEQIRSLKGKIAEVKAVSESGGCIEQLEKEFQSL